MYYIKLNQEDAPIYDLFGKLIEEMYFGGLKS